MKVSVALPSATAVASATNHGQPIVLSKPDHPVSKAINSLARGVVGELVGGKPVSPSSAACSGARRSARDTDEQPQRSPRRPQPRQRGGRHRQRPGEDAPAPKRRADVPTDAPSSTSGYPTSPPAGTPGAQCRWPDRTRRVERCAQIRTDRRGPTASIRPPSRRAEAAKDRFEDLKESVHSELLQQLGPQLYDANLEAAELESKVRTVLADVLAASNRPLTRGDRERITQEISDDILGYGPLEPYLRDVDVAEVMVNGPAGHLARAQGQAGQGRRQVQGRGTPAPHHRQDRLAHRPPRRRVLAHGRRPTA